MAKKSKEEQRESAKTKPELEETIKELQARFGEGVIMRLGEARKVDVDVIPTGSPSLDIALGVGGIPKGRIIEIYGPEASGKTTLALHIVAEVQKRGGRAAYVDSEHALDPEYARRIGVKVDELLISQPDSGEQALAIVESLVRSGSVEAIVVDSVAALTPQAEIDGEMGEQHIGLQARLMSQALRKLTAISAKTQTVIIFINQIRMQIGMMFGNPETTPGGKALKFYASCRIEVRRAAQIKKGDEIVGSRIKAKVVKNKVAPPFKTAEFDIIYNEGISFTGDLINTALKYNVLTRSGSTYLFKDKKIAVGFDNTKEALKQDPELAREIYEELKAAAGIKK